MSESGGVLKQWMDAALLHPMDSFCVQSFQNDLMDAMVNAEIPLKRVINQALTISTRSQFRATEQHLRNLIVMALDRIPAFSEVFASVLAANVKSYTQSFASARLIVLRVSLVVLTQMAAQSAETGALISIATSQSLLLESMQRDPLRMQKIARSAVLRVLLMHKAVLLPIYVATITESNDVDQPQYNLWRALCESRLLTIEIHIKLWTSYLYWAFEAKNRTRVSLSIKDSRFQSLTPDVWESLFFPFLTKILRRSPDSALEATIELIRAVSFDIGNSAIMEVLMQVLTNKLKSTNEDVRRWAVSLAKALLSTFSRVDPFQKLIGVIISLLDGKHGLLTQFYMREAAFAVLCDGVNAIIQLSRSDQETIASSVLTVLVKAVEKEAHDATRDLGMLALGKWMALVSSSSNDAVWKTIENGLGHKQEVVVAGYVRTVAIFLLSTKVPTSEVVSHIHPRFTSRWLSIIKESQKKPTVVHLDGVLALDVVGRLALATSTMDQAFTDIIPTVLSNEGSFIMPSVKGLLQTLSAMSEQDHPVPEVTALSLLPQALTWILTTTLDADSSQTVYNILVELLCCCHFSIRHAAEQCIRSLNGSSIEAHLSGLLMALKTKLQFVAEGMEQGQQQWLNCKPSMNTTPSNRSVVPPSGILRHALRVIVPLSLREEGSLRDKVFAHVSWLAHHPFLIDGKTTLEFGNEWQRLLPCFLPSKEGNETENTRDQLDHWMERSDEMKDSIISHIVPFLFSTVTVERITTHRMLATLLEFAGNGESEHLVLHDILQERLVGEIHRLQLQEMTEEDDGLTKTRDEELYVPTLLSETSTTSTKTGQRGNEDEQWERQVREELARKKQSSTQSVKKLTGEEKAQLAQQQARRAELFKSLTNVERVIDLVAFLSSTRPDELHPLVPVLFHSLVLPLFTTRVELIKGTSMRALSALTRVISPDVLRSQASDLATCIGIVLRLRSDSTLSETVQAQTIISYHSLFLRTLSCLMDFCFGFQFDQESDYDENMGHNRFAPPTLHLLFPVLETVLRYDPAIRHWVLPLLATHASMIEEEEEEEVGDVDAQRQLRLPFIKMTLLLLKSLALGSIIPIDHEELKPVALLARICRGPLLSMEEWNPIVGEQGLLSEHVDVRVACLQALVYVAHETEQADDNKPLIGTEPPLILVSRFFLACFDIEEAPRFLANSLWKTCQCTLPPQFAPALLSLLHHPNDNVRQAAALAMADGMKQYPDTIPSILSALQTQFQRYIPPPPNAAALDAYGNPTFRRPGMAEPIEEQATVLPRCGVALCLEKLAGNAKLGVVPVPLTAAQVVEVVVFCIEYGLVDRHANVRAQMRKTGIQLVDVYGSGKTTHSLLETFEKTLDKSKQQATTKAKGTKGKTGEPEKTEDTSDHQREGVVVFLGALAKHMDKTDPKVSSIVDALLDALSIPSESVQRSVATCLAPLLAAVKDRSAAIITHLLEQATQGELFGDRMGAAFGVSACIKGLGISALKAHDVIPRLEDAMKSSGSNARQGAMLVFECLSERLGILFEPYLIMIVPMLLKCFADASPIVREAASETSKKMMANLSSHGVKLVLPSLLRALEETAWRTKQGGIQLLGSMAYCAPRQLGSCLPQVVPKIMQALTDSHPKVREASKNALRDIGSVVRNPEIASISSALLNALEDPNKYTAEALQQLQSTSFQHSIDAPSLALVMPIVTCGLKDRAGDAKKKAARIVGSMCSMIHDPKDLIPYMEMVLPSLKALLMDPIPEVRGVAAKAMGKLVKGLGELHFQDTLTWLIDAIKGDCGSVERSGAAQGLCEVLVALGKERVETTLSDEIFPLARHPKSSVREGVLWIIAFLPPALGKGFAVFLRQTLPIIVSGLSDEIDSVRDVAMHSGHVVVNAHALSHTKDILPSLEAGLFDDHWRIRQSSVTLLGDLMYRISGTKAIITSEEQDEDSGNAAGDRAILKILGMERRNAILSSLYMIRSDTSALVRQSALQVWKSVVANTPKTLRQILSTLMSVIVSALSGNNVEKQTMAGRTLGEIVRKLGENVLPEVVPILRSGLSIDNTGAMRQGACVGLTEVIECCTKKSLEDFVSTLVHAIVDGLCDPLPTVRQSAAMAFEGLHRNIGYRAIDETIPLLLQRIKMTNLDTQELALHGIQEILRVKSREVLPYLLPRLLTTPLSLASIHAISKVAQATGPVLHYQLEKIFGTLIPEYLTCLEQNDTDMANAIQNTLREVVLGIETSGIQWLAIEVCKHCDKERVSVQEQVLAFYLMGEFCQHTKTLYHDQVPLFLRQIVTHLNDTETSVVQAALDTLKGMNHTITPEEFSKHVDFIRQGINSLVSDARHRKGGVGATGEFLLPALCLPKGLEHFLPGYQYALMNGTPELRQSAAAGIGELVILSSPTTLRPYLIKLTGPLIRIAGDRFPGHVKAAILQTLEILLEKGGVALKPFLPQLQTTFVKALNDPSSEVRQYGTSALGKLVVFSARVDPLIAELTEKMGAADGNIREANLDALILIMTHVGNKVSDSVRLGLEQALQDVLDTTDDESRERAASCLAMTVISDPIEEQGVAKTLEYSLTDGKSYLSNATWTRKHSVAVFVEKVWNKPPQWIQTITTPLSNTILELGTDDHVSVRLASIRAIGVLLKHSSESIDPFVPILAQGIAHSNKDISKHAVKIVKRIAKRDVESVSSHLSQLVPVTFGLIKSNNLAVKNSAERALLYLLDVFKTPETLSTYVRTDTVHGKVIAEYARRVLMKLKPDSEDESE